MIDFVSRKILDWMIRNDAMKSQESEIYLFGIHQGIMSAINIITTIIIAAIMHMLLEGVVFILAYMPLRSYAGGYHARTERTCYILSAVLSFTLLSVCKVIDMNWLLLFFLILSFLIIWFISPVEDSNKPLENIEIIVYSKKCKKIIILEMMVLIACYLLQFDRIVRMICVAHIALSIIIILGVIRNHKIKHDFEGRSA